jgi:hypothetical protein
MSAPEGYKPSSFAADDADARVVPPPTDPMGVARCFADDRYHDERGCRLIHHRGLFYSWDGMYWPEGEERAVRSDLYRWLEEAFYFKSNGDDPEPVPFQPSNTVDRKYRDPWTGRLPTRFVVLTNEIPRFSDASGALASRFVILTLTNSFYGREDITLTDQLLAEAPGIFNWCMEGLDRLVERGHFVQPQVAQNALQHLEDLASPVGAFVRDRCVVDPERVVDKDELWKAWKEWCSDEGAHPGTKSVLIRDLRASVPGAIPRRLVDDDGNRRNVVAGIRLQPTVENTPDTPDGTRENDAASGMSGVSPTVDPRASDPGGGDRVHCRTCDQMKSVDVVRAGITYLSCGHEAG